MPPKAKAFDIAASTAALARDVGDDVEVAVGVGLVVVDRRGDHAVADRHHAGEELDGAGAADQVAVHRLGRGDEEVVGVGAEDGADGGAFGAVVDRGAGAVGVDVADRLRARGRRRGGRRAWRARRPSGSG